MAWTGCPPRSRTGSAGSVKVTIEARLCMLEEPGQLADLLDAHPQVAAVLTGRAHTAAASTFAARPLIVGPAVTWTLRIWAGRAAAHQQRARAVDVSGTEGPGRVRVLPTVASRCLDAVAALQRCCHPSSWIQRG